MNQICFTTLWIWSSLNWNQFGYEPRWFKSTRRQPWDTWCLLRDCLKHARSFVVRRPQHEIMTSTQVCGFSYSMFILHAIRWGRTLKPLYPLVSCNIIFCIIGQISKKFVGCFLPETTTLNWMLSTSRLSHFFPFMCFENLILIFFSSSSLNE